MHDMTAIARLVAVSGVALIVLLVITGEWYCGMLAFFALAIVVPARWSTGDRR